MILPAFASLRRNYPTDASPDAVRLWIGGEIGAMPPGTNTCMMRMSQAFNYAGSKYEIPYNPKTPVSLYTLKGKDGKNYAVRVAEFVRYLHIHYGRLWSFEYFDSLFHRVEGYWIQAGRF